MGDAQAFYGDDLAAIHHEGFGDLARGAAPALLAALCDAGFAAGTVVDLGCGGGLWLRALGRAGYDAFGVDVSPRFVALARETAPGATVVQGSAFEVALPPCVAVTALGEVLCYAAPGGDAPPLDALARRVVAALAPGGLFLFDVMVREPEPLPPRCAWRAGESWAVLAESVESLDRTRLTRRIVTFRRDGASAHYRRSDETHVQVLRPAHEIEALLAEAGFDDVHTARSYGGHPLAPGRMAFAARKPGSAPST